MKKSFFTILLTTTLIIGSLANGITASAAEPADIQDFYVYDGITYFNVNSEYVASSSQLFIKDCLTATNADHLDVDELSITNAESTANLWEYIALSIQQQLGTGTEDAYFKTELDNALTAYISNHTLGTTSNLTSGINNYNVSSSGLQYASSLKQAGANIQQTLYQYYQNANGSRDMYATKAKNAAISSNATLAENEQAQDVFWTLLSANKTSGTFKKGHYQALAVIFSDFTLSPITPEDEGNNYVTYEASPSTSTTFSTGVRNDSSLSVDASQSLTQSTSLEVASEVNGSREYIYGQAIGGTLNIGNDVSFISGSINLDFTFEEVVQKGWSTTDATTTTTEHTSEVAISVPAYTTTMLTSETTTWSATTTYNCPVALGFKVTVVEYTLDPSSNNAEPATRILAVYSDARSTLYQYAVTELNVKSSDNMNWSKTTTATQAVAKKLATTAPIASTDASMSIDYTIVASTINDYAPLYSLSVIKPVTSLKEINLSLGEYQYLDEIELEGYNAKGGVYYGFDTSKGHWVLVNEENEEIGAGNENSAAILETDSVTHEVILKAQTDGTVYLKYKIDENCYPTASDANAYATNDSITTTILKVNVDNKLSTTTPTIAEQIKNIEITTTRDMFLDDLKALDILPSSDENAIVSYLSYDTFEADIAQGTRLNQTIISDLDVGTYYIRAKEKNNYSEVVTVNLVENELTRLTIPTQLTIKAGDFVRLSDLYLQGYDQNDHLIPVTDITWYSDSEKVSFTDDMFSFDESGTYTLYAVSNDINSNKMAVTVLPVDSQDNDSDDEDLTDKNTDTPSTEAEDKKTDTVQTGDHNALIIWSLVSLTCVVIIITSFTRYLLNGKIIFK